ncbi:ABC-type metal ion transport system, periplasmic component/surface adhesin [Thioflavicoccus mobilis 8321]|uniref:High-affinity zinc uptake system protein ZnuA n=1 Tax=Thioflavicoccus mobilis 8321 TaxID=765912 RepID=L0GUD1_9GAMM|nr:zinc ABC transporter substrate-binding protein [Thioflavicoccus mobilis]AGA88919.1 ABC-type metal ion transport system, periplasmic component/surface adhesin [Thioflavicoccus mobilis 8321]
MLKLAAVLIALTCLATPVSADDEHLSVFVSVPPQKTFVERIGGNHVEVTALLQPESNPHTYEPTPRFVEALAAADLFMPIGMPFEAALMNRLRAANPTMAIVDARKGLSLRPLDKHVHEAAMDARGHQDHEDHAADDEHHDTDENALDPHVWTSPPLVATMATTIRDELTRLDPDHAADYAANLDVFVAELHALDAAIRADLAPLAGSAFMVYHPAWGYFAETYGLIQIPIEHEGKSPGPRTLSALIDRARAAGIQVILVEPQFSPRAAEQVARAIGGRVATVDPLTPDYIANLRQVAHTIAAAARP